MKLKKSHKTKRFEQVNFFFLFFKNTFWSEYNGQSKKASVSVAVCHVSLRRHATNVNASPPNFILSLCLSLSLSLRTSSDWLYLFLLRRWLLMVDTAETSCQVVQWKVHTLARPSILFHVHMPCHSNIQILCRYSYMYKAHFIPTRPHHIFDAYIFKKPMCGLVFGQTDGL